MKPNKTIVLAVLAIVSCTYALAQAKSVPKRLDSFCGFKAGESRAELRKTIKVDPLSCTVMPRKRFRNFSQVSLLFSNKGELSKVGAAEDLSNATLDEVIKEPD